MDQGHDAHGRVKYVIEIAGTREGDPVAYYGPRTLPVGTPVEAWPFDSSEEAQHEVDGLRASGFWHRLSVAPVEG